MSTDQILFGLGLTLVLAVGSQVLASRLRIPAIIVLLPVGFVAGALTDDINPNRLLGPAFSPLVSLSVAVILYDAGLGLNLRGLKGHTRRTVVKLISVGIVITWVFAGLVAAWLLGMSAGAAVMIGVILVVSGPTVVGPLLNFVRPAERLQHILSWEGSLIDPVGAVTGALVFHAVMAGTRAGAVPRAGQFLASFGVGLAGAAVGTAVLWLLLSRIGLGEVLGTAVQLATVIGVAAGCDIARDDTGLIAAIIMGLAVANMPNLDIASRRLFFETLVQLILGLLFVSISSTVTPESLRHLVPPTLGLVAILVLIARPVVALVCTVRTDLTRGERGFVGWMAPRGIVAAATASTYSAALVTAGIDGAEKILPVTFLVIVSTVTLYGLTAAPVARLLRVIRPARTRPLLVGEHPWVVDLGKALRSLGLEVLLWAGLEEQRHRIRAAGLELAPGDLLASASGRGAQIEGVTDVLLLTDEDDFNALLSTMLQGSVDGGVYRLGPPGGSHGVVAPYTGGELLFGADLTRPEMARRYEAGARIEMRRPGSTLPGGRDLLFLVRADGRLVPMTGSAPPTGQAGDSLVLLCPPGEQETRVSAPATRVPSPE